MNTKEAIEINQKNEDLRCVSTQTSPHFLWGKGCEGWWLKKNGNFTLISEIMPPDTSEIRHLHKHAEQFFYVLEGVLSIQLEGYDHRLNQHEGLVVPPGIPHRVFNNSQQVVKFLVVSCPDSHEDRIDLEEALDLKRKRGLK